MHPFLSLLLALVCLAPRLPVSEAASPAAAARALLQQEAQGSTCAWQEAYEYCSPSVETSEGYISETIDSPLKDIMIESLVSCGVENCCMDSLRSMPLVGRQGDSVDDL